MFHRSSPALVQTQAQAGVICVKRMEKKAVKKQRIKIVVPSIRWFIDI